MLHNQKFFPPTLQIMNEIVALIFSIFDNFFPVVQSAHFGFILSVKVIYFGFPNTEVNRTRLKNFDFIARMILIIFFMFCFVGCHVSFCDCFCLAIYMFLCFYVKPHVTTVESRLFFSMSFCIYPVLYMTETCICNSNRSEHT